MSEEDAVKVQQIPEPFGWQSLYAAVDSGELENDDQDKLGNEEEVDGYEEEE
jgi:hypothetical protein